jgi:predicted transcriptional regulator
MKGLWTARDIENGRTGNNLAEEAHLVAVLKILEASKNGLSNAEIDAALNNSSQWVAMWHIRELIAGGLVRYEVQLFGEPGKYTITESGLAFLHRIGPSTGPA